MAFRTHLYTIIHQDDTYEFYIKCDVDCTVGNMMHCLRRLQCLVTKSYVDNSETYDIISTEVHDDPTTMNTITVASSKQVHIKAIDIPRFLNAKISSIFDFGEPDEFRSRASMKFDAEYKWRVQGYMQALAPDDLWRVRNIIETSQEQLRPFQHRIDIVGNELRFGA